MDYANRLGKRYIFFYKLRTITLNDTNPCRDNISIGFSEIYFVEMPKISGIHEVYGPQKGKPYGMCTCVEYLTCS